MAHVFQGDSAALRQESANCEPKPMNDPFFFFKSFLIDGYLLYSIVLVSAIHQQESAIGNPISPPS